jgi:PKD repeat protein
MKQISYFILSAALLLTSCEKVPEAFFIVDKVEPEVGQEVFFTNQSLNSESFEWDFGDGTLSNDPNPVHIYNATGIFQVELTAVSKTGTIDKAFQTITVKVPTLLEIEVLEWYDKYPVENASIILFPTLSDWDSQTNSIIEGFTNVNGIAVFSGLGNFVYYLDIWEANHNNYAIRDYDVSYIRTPEVTPNKITRFVAYVDYVPGTKGDGKRDRTMVIKRIERK